MPALRLIEAELRQLPFVQLTVLEEDLELNF